LIVVDASIALAWMLEDETEPRAERALDEVRSTAGLAPSIWLYEVTNALMVAERRGRTGRPVREMLADLASLDITIVEPRGLPLSEYELAVEHRLSVYDSPYLHVAIEKGAKLATLDTELGRAARKRKVLF
jgi:predicted nucleic acid-binding protein